MIFTKEQLNRCKFEKENLFVDLHELSEPQAKRFVQNILLLAKEPIHIIFIHGYHGGTKLRDLLRGSYFNSKYEIYADEVNEGRTHFVIA